MTNAMVEAWYNDRAGQVLSCPMAPNDINARTVGEYLSSLLLALWLEEEGFSSKRPFGNSGWKYDVYIALIKAGLITGEIETDNGFTYLVNISDEEMVAADKLIIEAINRRL